jgi:hypothetical protein
MCAKRSAVVKSVAAEKSDGITQRFIEWTHRDKDGSGLVFFERPILGPDRYMIRTPGTTHTSDTPNHSI